MADKDTYDLKYCEKHNHSFYEFLPECPICVGERLDNEAKMKQLAFNLKLDLDS